MTDSAQGERVLVHPILGVISGMCSDERPYPEIDSKVLEAKGRAHKLEAERDRLLEAFDELWEVATDMRPYVPEYFAEKWHHDRDLAAAKEMRDA